MTKQALIIFAKNPEAGKVKTRLAATLGDEEALSVYKQLLLHTVTVTQNLAVDKYVFYSNHIGENDLWNSKDYYKKVQRGNDLGERMKCAFIEIFQKGYNRAVIIGTDCFDLTSEIIMNAFLYLQSNDVAIGPAEDGGYYLLGLKKVHQELFKDIFWSTNTVLKITINKIIMLKLTYTLLPVLQDIDEEKDLKKFKLQKQ
jgi:rSAM/selenodomain-associated transferase 1